jgi:hypothetical protein
MKSNELAEHVRKLNEQESVQHELRKQQALNRIRELRKAIKEQEELKHKEKYYGTYISK